MHRTVYNSGVNGRGPLTKHPAVMAAAFVWAASVVLIVHLADFHGSVRDFTHASGGGTLLDAVPAFTPDDIYRRLDGYGAPGRDNYRFRNLTIDVLLPLSVLPF